ncbi:receptor-type tyrosine-protein phosphatase C-like [Cyprinus carpio]|uniref:Receptor-type tyrosine-protein phosphatase C-like n=1 Tax=Cyprinus carpio TaxID=7962 RepID=A0A9Q9XPD5_CYPCA|nr:receptor-type tyrosine-protein phosphatase C-like [Cyprinus carpio]
MCHSLKCNFLVRKDINAKLKGRVSLSVFEEMFEPLDMARLFALGPLVLILCLVLCTTGSPCQYSVLESVKEKAAHVVNIKGSEDQIYTIRIKDKHNEIRAEQISNQTPFKIPFEWLKPCTVYTVSVDDCGLSGRNTFTSSKNGETVSKTVVRSVTDNEVCLKGVFTDIQWNLTECVEITEQNSCASTHTVVLDTCNYTMNVALPPVKPHINFSKTIPSQFEWTNKPAQCNAALLIINCINNENKNSIIYGLNTPVSLLPDTEYTCTGEYPYETQHIKSNELSFKIKCDWQKNGRFQPLSSTSLEISWNSLEGDKCSGIKWESYSVSCSDGNSQKSKSSNFPVVLPIQHH